MFMQFFELWVVPQECRYRIFCKNTARQDMKVMLDKFCRAQPIADSDSAL